MRKTKPAGKQKRCAPKRVDWKALEIVHPDAVSFILIPRRDEAVATKHAVMVVVARPSPLAWAAGTHVVTAATTAFRADRDGRRRAV